MGFCLECGDFKGQRCGCPRVNSPTRSKRKHEEYMEKARADMEKKRERELWLDAAKKETICRGCDDPIIKGCLRVCWRVESKKYGKNETVYEHKDYYHIPCWLGCDRNRGIKSFSQYNGHCDLSPQVQNMLQNVSTETNKFIQAGEPRRWPQKKRKAPTD